MPDLTVSSAVDTFMQAASQTAMLAALNITLGGSFTTTIGDTSITGGGTISLGGFTLTVGATGTAALLGVANVFTVNGAASTPAMSITGTPFTGGSATTTKPLLLIEPAGTASTGWDTGGTMLGVNAPSGFVGILADLQLNGASKFSVSSSGAVRINGTSVGNTLAFRADIGFLDINGFGGQSGTAIGGEAYLPGVSLGKNSAVRWTNDGTAGTPDIFLTRASAGVLFLSADGSAGAAFQMAEQTAPAAPAANQVRIYAVDNGAGKTQLMALFSSGAAQQIAIEP